MSTYENKKDVNENKLHIANQIKKFIEFETETCLKDKQKILNFLNTISIHFFRVAPSLHCVYGNNISKTLLIDYFVEILIKFDRGTLNDINENLIANCVFSLIWNLSDDSTLFCKKLVSINHFKETIVSILMKTNISEENKNTLYFVISVISNISRKEELRHVFKEYDIFDKIYQFYCRDFVDRSLKLICLTLAIYLLTEKKFKEYKFDLASLEDDLVGILDGASNDENFCYESFQLSELLLMFQEFTKMIPSFRTFCQNKESLKNTFIRLLSKKLPEQKEKQIIGIINTIYDDEEKQKIKDIFKSKFGDKEFLKLF